MTKLACAFISLFFLVASPAVAAGRAGNNWTVTQLSGDARVVHPGAQPASVKVNGELAPGDTLLTGPSGRATLVRGGDYIIVSPHSELRLPSAAQPDGFTRVIQNLGTMLFKVRHTGIPHFAVDTPMLAAVVKGTTFTVVVDQQRSVVQVIQGVVQVSTADGAMSRMVEGGKTVFVNHANPKVLLDADKPAPATGAQSSTSIKISAAGESPLAAISTLTGGLVRADLSASQAPAAAAAAPSQPALPDAAAVTLVALTPTTKPVVAGPALPVVVATNVPPAIPGVTGPTPPVTTPAVTLPSVSTPSVVVPSATTPSVTLPSTPTVIVPSVSTGSGGSGGNSGPGSISSSNSGPGSISSSNSGLGSISGSNSGPGSLSSGQSGSGSGSVASTTPTVTVPSVTTPTVTVPSITTPIVTVPSVTVPSVSTPAITIPTVTVLGLKR